MPDSKKILVTGTAGFIGFHLAERLIKEGYDVYGLDVSNDYYDINLKYARLEEHGISLDTIPHSSESLLSRVPQSGVSRGGTDSNAPDHTPRNPGTHRRLTPQTTPLTRSSAVRGEGDGDGAQTLEQRGREPARRHQNRYIQDRYSVTVTRRNGRGGPIRILLRVGGAWSRPVTRSVRSPLHLHQLYRLHTAPELRCPHNDTTNEYSLSTRSVQLHCTPRGARAVFTHVGGFESNQTHAQARKRVSSAGLAQ